MSSQPLIVQAPALSIWNELYRGDHTRQAMYQEILKIMAVLGSLVTALVLSYSTGFMLKLRKKEFGMYLTLGMPHRNIQWLFACETGILSLAVLVVGICVSCSAFAYLIMLASFTCGGHMFDYFIRSCYYR